MKIILDLTKDEIRALRELVYENPCLSGCVWDECEEKASHVKGEKLQYEYCYWGCKFHKAQESLQDKIESCMKPVVRNGDELL